MSTRGQGHCLTFVQGHSDLYFQTYSQAAGHISQILRLHFVFFQPLGTKLQSDTLFETLSKEIKNRPGVVKKINAVFQWCITVGGKLVSEWSKLYFMSDSIIQAG